MNFKKIISSLAAVTMIASAFTSFAYAATGLDKHDEYDDGYYIENVEGIENRTPKLNFEIETLTAQQIVDLKTSGISGLNSKKLKVDAGNYADTASWTVFKVTPVVTDIGDMLIGYDTDDNDAYIKLAGFAMPINIAGTIIETGTRKTDYDWGVDSTTRDVALDLGYTPVSEFDAGTKLLNVLLVHTDMAKTIPTGNATTDEDDYFTVEEIRAGSLYFALPVGSTLTLSTSDTAGVKYDCKVPNEGVNKILTAKFGVKSFTLPPAPTGFSATFKSEGVEIPALAQTNATNITLPAAPTAPEHKTFGGWNDGTNTYAASAAYTLTADTVFNAVWNNETSYTVTFGDTSFTNKYANDTVTAPAAPTAPANKHFTGWSCDSGATKVAAGATVTVTGNATYVACFENDPQYTVTFKAGTETVSTITDYAGAAITAPNQAAVEAKYRPAGQHFTGWDVTPAATISATVTYNAVYADNQVAVTYSTDLTGVTGMPSNTTVVKGNTISVPSVTLPVDKKDATWTLNGEPFTSTYTVTGEEGAINIILAAADKAVVNVSVAGLPAELTAKLFDNGLAVTLDDVAKTSLGFTAMEGQVLKVTAAANFLPEYEFKGIKVNNVAKAVNEGVTVGTDAISVVLEYEFKQAVIDDGAEEFGIEPTTELNDTCYGFALAPANLFQDVANFKYIVKATDSNSETKEWDLTKFGGIDGISSNQEGYTEAKIKAEDFANMPSFYVVVRSTTHQITKVEIIKRAIED